MTRLTIDELEVLTPDELGMLLRAEVDKTSPDIQFIQDLLFVGYPIDGRNANGMTCLHHAASAGKLEMVEILISLGASVYATDDRGWTALRWASNFGRFEVWEFLIYKRAEEFGRIRKNLKY